MNLTYENTINYKDYNRLRDEVKWGALSDEQAQIGLENSTYIISCKDNDKVIGTARLMWDGGYAAYICDVMVSPEYQKKGIGKYMITSILDYLKNQLKDGWKIMITLVAAKEKEEFYRKFGFERRPSEIHGCGMCLCLR